MAIKAGQPIVPVSISGTRFIQPRGTIRMQPGPIKVVISPPIDPGTFRRKEDLMAAVRQAIARPLRPRLTPMAPPNPPANWVDLTFLGGLGEIGLNLMTLETADYLVVVDAGLMFPEDHMLGIDIVIPDFSYLRERRDKVAALVLTHGHEDHIGAVPFLLKEIPVPVYGTPLTLALLREKLREHGLLDDADLREISPGSPWPWGPSNSSSSGCAIPSWTASASWCAPPRASWCIPATSRSTRPRWPAAPWT